MFGIDEVLFFIVTGGLLGGLNDKPRFDIKATCGATSDDKVGTMTSVSVNNVTDNTTESTDIPS